MIKCTVTCLRCANRSRFTIEDDADDVALRALIAQGWATAILLLSQGGVIAPDEAQCPAPHLVAKGALASMCAMPAPIDALKAMRDEG